MRTLFLLFHLLCVPLRKEVVMSEAHVGLFSPSSDEERNTLLTTLGTSPSANTLPHISQ